MSPDAEGMGGVLLLAIAAVGDIETTVDDEGYRGLGEAHGGGVKEQDKPSDQMTLAPPSSFLLSTINKPIK